MIHRALFLLSGALLAFGAGWMITLHWVGIPVLVASLLALRLLAHIPYVQAPHPCAGVYQWNAQT